MCIENTNNIVTARAPIYKLSLSMYTYHMLRLWRQRAASSPSRNRPKKIRQTRAVTCRRDCFGGAYLPIRILEQFSRISAVFMRRETDYETLVSEAVIEPKLQNTHVSSVRC